MSILWVMYYCFALLGSMKTAVNPAINNNRIDTSSIIELQRIPTKHKSVQVLMQKILTYHLIILIILLVFLMLQVKCINTDWQLSFQHFLRKKREQNKSKKGLDSKEEWVHNFTSHYPISLDIILHKRKRCHFFILRLN